MTKRFLSGDALQQTSYNEEDGKVFIGHHTDLAPHMKRVQYLRDVGAQATRKSNPNGWQHKATVPIPVITDWCRRNGYTFDQWARNEGGIRGKTYPHSTNGVKDKFMKYFLSREFSKLHNEHITTKRESSVFTVPQSIARNAMDLTGIGQ